MLSAGDLLQQAAHGSASAQSMLVDVALSGNDSALSQAEALAVSEVLARMAASHGDIADIRRLGGVLLLRGGFERRRGNALRGACLDAEALWALELAANNGDEDAAVALVLAADELPAASFQLLPIGKLDAERECLEPEK